MAIAYQGPALPNDIIYPSVSEILENAIGSKPRHGLGQCACYVDDSKAGMHVYVLLL